MISSSSTLERSSTSHSSANAWVQYDDEGIKHFYFEFVDATKKGNLGVGSLLQSLVPSELLRRQMSVVNTVGRQDFAGMTHT
jgi:hypothetical protein